MAQAMPALTGEQLVELLPLLQLVDSVELELHGAGQTAPLAVAGLGS